MNADDVVDGRWSVTVAVVVGVGLCLVMLAVMWSRHKGRGTEPGRLVVDDAHYFAIFIYFLQILNLWTDVLFALQCREYRHYAQSATDGLLSTELFETVYPLSVVFVVAPYVLNLYSSAMVQLCIFQNDNVSSYSTAYFGANYRLYTALVLLSGGSFPSLLLVNSNVERSHFSAGLSGLQQGQCVRHHVLASVLTEMVPQLALQSLLMFQLDVRSNTVAVSAMCSMMALILSVWMAMRALIRNRKCSEIPWSIHLSWFEKQESLEIFEMETDRGRRGNPDPYSQCGQRRAATKRLNDHVLGQDPDLKFQVLASEWMESGCVLHGVLVSESTVDVADLKAKCSNVLSQHALIRDAVMEAFQFATNITDLHDFKVTVPDSMGSTKADRVQMALAVLAEMNVSKATIAGLMHEIKGSESDLERARKLFFEIRRLGFTMPMMASWERERAPVSTASFTEQHAQIQPLTVPMPHHGHQATASTRPWESQDADVLEGIFQAIEMYESESV